MTRATCKESPTRRTRASAARPSRRPRCIAPTSRRAEGRRPQARGRLGRHAGAVPDRQGIRRRRPRGRLDRAQAGRRHESHRHHNCDEFFIVLKGTATSTPTTATSPRAKATWSIRRASCWHGFNNTSTRTSCWCGAGWAPARSRRPATRSAPDDHQSFGSRLAQSWRWGHDPAGRARCMRYAGAARTAAQRLAAGDTPLGWKVGFAARLC